MNELGTTDLRPGTTSAEHLRLAIIFLVLVGIVSVPAFLWVLHERNRPMLVEVRVVTATAADPVYREGSRVVEADEEVFAAVALRLEFPGKGSTWHAPVPRLLLDGEEIDHVETDRWPEEDRSTTVFWFTLEGPYLGGSLRRDEVATRLACRSFLAPEMGRAWKAEGEPESHADDGVNLGKDLRPTDAGTYRLYARVHLTEERGGSLPLAAATSLGPSEVENGRMTRISRRLEGAGGIRPEVGELFRLPGFEAADEDPPEMEDLCRRRLATSSRTFAALAVSATPYLDESALEHLATTALGPGGLQSSAGPLGWNDDVREGDLLRRGERWLVLLADDGNGIFDTGDLVAGVWRRPAAILPLGSALDPSEESIEVLRSRATPP